MSTKSRNPQRVRALLCASAAAAVLIGGGSTYALWSETGSRDIEDDISITAGSWEWSIEASQITWYDSSVEHDGTEFVDDSLSAELTGLENLGWANTWNGNWVSNIEGTDFSGYPIDLEAFHMVPGDRITGVFTVAAHLTVLDGQNLRAEVTVAYSVSESGESADPPLVVSSIIPTAGANRMAIVVEYPDTAVDYDQEVGKGFSVVNLGNYTVTVTQVRPAGVAPSGDDS
ncbi:hypothetical protein [Xylanimonas protaetiae]|uniref:Alternate-type signal peptide domain-containing protein n=1 Tax=Xylanimonas protaetiae TaxID=2509457 RepID=A0A4P6F2J2_9MICO|nr:hypothetical protein [Xylanimonas protaetiae]QAY69385.1 hypothetical protein ET471_04450 [Xylanimonas protaetiae]